MSAAQNNALEALNYIERVLRAERNIDGRECNLLDQAGCDEEIDTLRAYIKRQNDGETQ